MNDKETEYIPVQNHNEKLIRMEFWAAPLLIAIPIIVSLLFLWSWFSNGYSQGSSAYDGELLIALLILVGNIIFDIPFLRALISFKRRE